MNVARVQPIYYVNYANENSICPLWLFNMIHVGSVSFIINCFTCYYYKTCLE